MSENSAQELELIYLFIHLVHAGSFSQAAKELNIPVATVSRKLVKLEERQDHLLFMRSTRKLRLTEEGLALFERYHELIDQFDKLSGHDNDIAEGTLRIAAPISIISILFIEILNEFSCLYPDIKLHISQSNQVIDLIDEGVDVAIVGGAQPDSSWISSTLGVLNYCLMASPNYLKSEKNISHPSDLYHHKLIKVWPLYNWLLKNDKGEHFYHDEAGQLTLTDLHGAIEAAIHDGGVLYGPELFVKTQLANGALVRVLAKWQGEKRRISILYHQRRHQPLKVKLFIEFMQKKASALFVPT